jgi:opacity protein-like surface antigen
MLRATTRLLVLLVSALTATPAMSQRILLGGKVGSPILDPFVQNVGTGVVNNYNFQPRRYTIGPSVELMLPVKLAVEASALYKQLSYGSNPFNFDTVHATTTGDSWEFPLILKRHFLSHESIRPYGNVGLSLRRVTGSTEFTSPVGDAVLQPLELVRNWSTGVVVGAGVDISIGRLHVLPEIRYTRWGNQNFVSDNGVFESNRNSADILIGFAFGK